MRAVSRFGMALLAGALALSPLTALAQEVPPQSSSTTNTPAADAIGPKSLQNFSLNGTVTHAADQPVAVPPATAKKQPSSQAQATAQPATGRPAPTAAAPATAAPRVAHPQNEAPAPTETAQAAAQPLSQPQPASSVTVPLPKLQASTTSSAAPPPSFAPAPDSPGTLAAGHGFSMLPWLLAALAVAIGGAFLLWRNRNREAFAGGPQVDAFVAPEPAPAPMPEPRPAPPRPAPSGDAVGPSSFGFVSTQLRPWIEIGFHPTRCILEDQRVVVDFELELFNSGSAPARGVLVEASLFNAGPTQDEQIASFFGNPVGAGERIVAIPPLQRVAVRTQVIAPREQIQAYELGGRQVFIPLIAFNALYSWSRGDGQTSTSYLLGRDAKSEKMGPFRLDLGPRIFRDVAARPLPAGVRK